jgi:membrane protease YdiL (CAAX protease family)
MDRAISNWMPVWLRRVFCGPTELRAGWRLLIFVGILLSIFAVKDAVYPKAGVDNVVIFGIGEYIACFIFVVATWCMAKIEGRKFSDYGLPWRKMLGKEFWQGLAVGFVLISTLLGLLRLGGSFHFGAVNLHPSEMWKWAGFYALFFLSVGFKEEFQFRGYAQYTLASGIGWWPAAAVWSLFFALGHAHNPNEAPIGLFNAVIFGLLSCLIIRRTGNLWMMIGLHAGFDWGETFFYGVADSGIVLPGHLFSGTSSGSTWLTGGAVGPEGGLLCTLLFLVLGVIVFFWPS